MRVTLRFDGGARPTNPGPAACAWTIEHDGRLLQDTGKFIGHATNNVAEYMGLCGGLANCAILAARQVDVRSDSKLVIEQMAGRWRVKNAGLRDMHLRATTLLAPFESVTWTWVPREENSKCDAICTNILLSR